MFNALFTCFGVVIGLVGTVLLLVYVVIPVVSHAITFFGRLVRFVFQEMRIAILLPIALFVSIIKIIRATLCVILARWDIAHTEVDSAKRRLREAWEHVVAFFVDNPLRILAIEPQRAGTSTQYRGQSSSYSNSPHRFKGYVITGTLQSGGSGAKVYIAKASHGGPKVVIKCFDITSGSQLPQIIRESRAMEAAKKLGVVLEHHLDANQFWYSMPYHEGDNLSVVTKKLHKNKSALTSKQLRLVVSYQQSLLQTLQVYHNSGLWHKDVKPDNIIVHDGVAHLVDLGLVTPLASAMTLTTHGTEYFRDPELVRQATRGVKVHQVNGSKFDVYGAGAVLYYMLENTFPAHGCLSDFSKQSPEGLRWIVRRAMADYDKRYNSVEEMLLDIEAVLCSKDISSIRPADLPSVNGQAQKPHIPTESVRRLPAKTTPSTGGGPFRLTKDKTKPLGLFALIGVIIAGALAIKQSTKNNQEPNVAIEQIDITQKVTAPLGRVLVLNDIATLHNKTAQAHASNKIAELGVAGWDLFVDADREASVRTWLPKHPTTKPILSNKFDAVNIVGVLLIQEGEKTKPTIYYIDKSGAIVIE